MSNVYQDIETAVLAKIQADDWLVAYVKTMETDLPETIFQAVDFTEIFGEHQLPAVVVLASQDAPTSNDQTLGELRYDVPLSVLGVVKGTKKATVRNEAQELAGQIERVLNACRTSAAALAITGRGSLVKDVSIQIDIQRNEGARRYYGLVTVRSTIVVIRELET